MRQGRTDAWIAHQLEVSVKDLRQFKRDHELEAPEADSEGVHDDEDLRAADDELVAAALESESDEEDEDEDEDEGESGEDRPKRRRGRRGGRGRRSGGRRRELEGTFDHGDEGYGLWLDPAIQDDPVYAEHWAGHRPVTIQIEQDRIVIRRVGEGSANGDDPEAE